MKLIFMFMRRVSTAVLLAAVLLPAVNAQSVTRIGFVDPVRLIEQAPQGAKALESLEDEFRTRDEELKNLHDRVQAMEADLEKNILVMDATDAQTRQREIENLKRRLARSQQEAREDYNLRRNEELAKLQTLVRQVIVDLARDRGFDLVVEQAVYVSDAVDITDQVLEVLEKLP
ncbi:MAG: OmpH family outer membrane protein [Proteobacteria bacterium]|nr:OmpH family outer membrane protein [Pseudomonadota bacterium]MDB4826664.1 OmpH family outer membrane protein [Gammaproteobacteria bacterium]MBT4357916.1 OmpH family outer membrane protein [Pseudomonadota bacterium]MBT5189286.1 OmpH family outer membrane protein [Pseudomonadota bacterium]MBT5625113.1 OmpH family outer membrane protein [Pseudomonadota bacterium]